MESIKVLCQQLDVLGFEYGLSDCGEIERLTLPLANANTKVAKLPRIDTVRCLSAHFSDFNDEGLDCLMKFPNITDLWLFETRVKGAGLRNLSVLHNLRTLVIANGAEGIEAGTPFIWRTTSLVELQIRQTPLTDAGIEGLGELRRLEYLSLADAKITDAVAYELQKMQNLLHLYLPSTAISDRTVNSLTQLANLESLDIRWTNVTRKCLEELQSLPRLQYLYLGPIPTEGSLAPLAGFSSLAFLSFEGCAFSRQDISDLCRARQLESFNVERCTGPAGSNQQLKEALGKACDELDLEEID